MILCNNGPIPFDCKHIGGQCNNMQTAKTKRVIRRLLEKDVIFLDAEGCISEPHTEIMIKDRADYLKNHEKKFKSSRNFEGQNLSKQGLSDEDSISKTAQFVAIHHIPSNETTLDRSIFDIDWYLDDRNRTEIKKLCSGWDFQSLIQDYNETIRSGRFNIPTKPVAAFRGWVIKFTRERPP